MHQGVDFGAPTGTPIFASGDGIVEEVGFKGGYGRYIRINHNGKISTAYAHLSRFGRGIARGARVSLGMVIGFVGASGRATGPHLHYEVMSNGRQVNPLSVQFASGRALTGKLLAQFKDGQKGIKAEYNTILVKKNPVLATGPAGAQLASAKDAIAKSPKTK
jgi:murein DD-endopeptidase MepM/ murein hydrolase activator NlpD